MVRLSEPHVSTLGVPASSGVLRSSSPRDGVIPRVRRRPFRPIVFLARFVLHFLFVAVAEFLLMSTTQTLHPVASWAVLFAVLFAVAAGACV